MKKFLFCFIICFSMLDAIAASANQEYLACKNNEWNNIVVSPNFYFIKVTASADEVADAGSSQDVIDIMQLQAQGEVAKTKFFECCFDGVASEWPQSLKWKFFLSYLNCFPQKYTLKNSFPVKSIVSSNGAVYVLSVHKENGIIWHTKFPESFSEMVKQLYSKSGKRNALLFFEALTSQQEKDWQQQVFMEISSLYGTNIANILLKKNAVQVDNKTYSAYKKSIDLSKLSNCSLERLLCLFNTLPAERNIQNEIIQRFQFLGMKKSASLLINFHYEIPAPEVKPAPVQQIPPVKPVAPIKQPVLVKPPATKYAPTTQAIKAALQKTKPKFVDTNIIPPTKPANGNKNEIKLIPKNKTNVDSRHLNVL